VQQLRQSLARIQREQQLYIETFSGMIDYNPAPLEPVAPAPAAAPPTVRHWNPQTGRLE
jgi:hypothetical protein